MIASLAGWSSCS